MSLAEQQQQPAAESRLLSLVGATKSRGQKASTEQLEGILESIGELEAAGGITDPARSPIIQVLPRLTRLTKLASPGSFPLQS
jgi:hypothetical protein